MAQPNSQDNSQAFRESGEVSRSNRGETSPLSVPSAFGVDRVSLSFQAYDFDPNASTWTGHSEGFSDDGVRVSESFSRQVELVDGVKVFVSVLRRFEPSVLAPVHAKIELNPARVVDPGGHSLASVSDTIEAVNLAVNSVLPYVQPLENEGRASYKINRLDVAKDFHDVASASALIRGLAPIPRKWARRNFVHADPSRFGAQTLTVGSGAGLARLYDKFEETKGAVPPGTVRWETEARRDWCSKYGGMSTLRDLNSEGLKVLARDRWEWSAMGVDVASTKGVVEVLARSGLTPRESALFLGWLVTQSTPHAYQPGSKTTLAKFRKLQRDLNISLGPDCLESVGFVSRLDWDSSTVVTHVA